MGGRDLSRHSFDDGPDQLDNSRSTDHFFLLSTDLRSNVGNATFRAGMAPPLVGYFYQEVPQKYPLKRNYVPLCK